MRTMGDAKSHTRKLRREGIGVTWLTVLPQSISGHAEYNITFGYEIKKLIY